MKNGQIRVVTAAVDNRRKRIIYLLPLFLAAVVIGFIIDLSFYQVLNIGEIRHAIVSLPTKWNQINLMERLDEVMSGDSDESLEEQSENETRIIEQFESPISTTPIWDTLVLKSQSELWEQPTLLNLNFSWLSNNEVICKLNLSGPKDLLVMPILVHTSRSHFMERLALRRTWGSLPIYKNWDIRFVFLLGMADRGQEPSRNKDKFEEQEKRLRDEQSEFGDLIIGSFADSYHNLTYKHLMGYKWVLNFCRDATFVMKIDDDMFIDIMRWLDWRSDDLDKISNDKSAVIPNLYCNTFRGTKPIREIGSKWYASPEDWPDPDYPDYCSGWAYALTVDLMQKIYLSSNDRKMFWVDDVFVTGALMEVAKKKFDFKPEVKHIWGEVTTDIAEYRPMCDNQSFDEKRKFRAVCYVPRGELFERDMMCMWNKTLLDRNDTGGNIIKKLLHQLF